MKPLFDLSVYLITSRNFLDAISLYDAVESALLGGCSIVQLREKNLEFNEFLIMARKIKTLTNKYNVPLIINDNIEVALASNADGLHIGSNDIPIEKARFLLGKNKIIGVSAVNAKEAINSEKNGADYIGVGAMFPTITKNDAKIVTFEELREIRAVCNLPLVVIGGINAQNIMQFENLNIDGIAVSSSILKSKNIKNTTSDMKKKIEKIKEKSL